MSRKLSPREAMLKRIEDAALLPMSPDAIEHLRTRCQHACDLAAKDLARAARAAKRRAHVMAVMTFDAKLERLLDEREQRQRDSTDLSSAAALAAAAASVQERTEALQALLKEHSAVVSTIETARQALEDARAHLARVLEKQPGASEAGLPPTA